MADKLTDMAYTKAEIKARNKSYGVASDDATTPTYSWGLNLRLEQSELDKLGIKELPEVGSELSLDIVAKVTRVAQSADEKNKQSVVELQITKMGVETDSDETPAPKGKASSVMSYHGGKNGS